MLNNLYIANEFHMFIGKKKTFIRLCESFKSLKEPYLYQSSNFKIKLVFKQFH